MTVFKLKELIVGKILTYNYSSDTCTKRLSGVKSGLYGGHAISPPYLIHWPGKCMQNSLTWKTGGHRPPWLVEPYT